MVTSTKMAEGDVFDKIDTKFIEQRFKNVHTERTSFNYICLDEEDWDEDAWKNHGIQFFRIVLPYQKVKNMDAEAVRKWMLRLAEERLGLVGQA